MFFVVRMAYLDSPFIPYNLKPIRKCPWRIFRPSRPWILARLADRLNDLVERFKVQSE